MAFVEVVFNLPLKHQYTYRVPSEFGEVAPGIRVYVPFGKRTITGVVVANLEKSNYSSVKNIIDVLDEKPLISEPMLNLTKWLSGYYLASWGQAIYLALPKGLDREGKDRVHLLVEDPHIELSERQRELYLLIGEQPGKSTSFYRKKFGRQSFNYFLKTLQNRGLIKIERYEQGARTGKLMRKFVLIEENYEQLRQNNEAYQKYIRRRPEVDTFFMDRKGQQLLLSEFLKKTGIAAGTLKKLIGYGLCRVEELPLQRLPDLNFHEAQKDIVLNDEQQAALEAISEKTAAAEFTTFLLHGVTGSGKTQVYIEAIRKTLAMGKNAIVLIPEISLTPQTVTRFTAIAEDEIAVFHSKMSLGERYDAWMACYTGKIRVVVGPRSALFAPLQNIGVIVVDEEHETTYKQSDTAPRYHARDVAVYWAWMNKAVVILGSATPSLESYYNARLGKYKLLEIRNRVDNIRMPVVTVIDMKKARARIEGEVSMFSQLLVEKITDRLQRNEQVIILQNRRGHSSFLQCKACGFISVCPNCDISLTYHAYNEQLQCHLCGHRQPAYHQCPACGDKTLAYKGVGTQRIQDELLKLFPQARVLRMDQDTTRGKNRHDKMLQAFGDHQADILLGTQMIAKGLDFENVTLVGVVSADVGLAIPDFRSAERVFQLLTQVAGRSGRGQKSGEVVVQSYLYNHYAVQLAREHDFIGYYMQEMQHRRTYRYPPFYKMIQVLVSAPKMSDAIDLARNLAVSVQRRVRGYAQLVGPAPGIIPRVNNQFRWQFTLKLNQKTDRTGEHTRRILSEILEPHLTKNNADIRVTVDVDALVLS